MKKYIFLVLLVTLPFVLAKTETVELQEGESFEIRDKNVTLIRFDSDDDKVVVCVNNEKAIISGDRGSVNGVTIDIRSVKENYARLELTRRCTTKCDCEKTSGDCSNIECFHECDIDIECDDGDESTKDSCKGSPRVCINKEIKEVECANNTDCDDNDGCTIDRCANNKCENTVISGCVEGGEQSIGDEEEKRSKIESYLIVLFIVLFLVVLIVLFFNVFKKKQRRM